MLYVLSDYALIIKQTRDWRWDGIRDGGIREGAWDRRGERLE
jgi:hypothetical protein